MKKTIAIIVGVLLLALIIFLAFFSGGKSANTITVAVNRGVPGVCYANTDQEFSIVSRVGNELQKEVKFKSVPDLMDAVDMVRKNNADISIAGMSGDEQRMKDIESKYPNTHCIPYSISEIYTVSNTIDKNKKEIIYGAQAGTENAKALDKFVQTNKNIKVQLFPTEQDVINALNSKIIDICIIDSTNIDNIKNIFKACTVKKFIIQHNNSYFFIVVNTKNDKIITAVQKVVDDLKKPIKKSNTQKAQVKK